MAASFKIIFLYYRFVVTMQQECSINRKGKKKQRPYF